jgi:hypothetical protein
MNDNVSRLLYKYRRNGIVIDTNLLLLPVPTAPLLLSFWRGQRASRLLTVFTYQRPPRACRHPPERGRQRFVPFDVRCDF